MRNKNNSLLKGVYAGLLIALLAFFGGAEGRVVSQAVSNVQAEQKNKYGIDKRSATEVQEQTTPDKFTQTEAHLQIKSVRDLLAAESSSRFIPYLDTIADCLVQEQELKNSHYVFYHATDNVWRLAQDVYTQLYARLKPEKTVGKEFTFLRFSELTETNAKDFLVNELKENGLVDDNGKVGAILLSVNLSLFGNVGFPSECTWEYFLRERKHKAPDRKTYEDMMNKFGLSHKYIDELFSLVALYDTKEKTLLQIFVPQDKVDVVGYLAWATGIPMHDDTIAWVNKYIKQKKWTYKDDKHVALWGMRDLADKFKKEQTKNPLFRDLIGSVKSGDFSVDSYLKVYRNTPWELSNINNTQVRLIFSPNVLLNPESGVRFYRRSTVSKKKLREYSKRLNEVIDKIIVEKEGESNA